MAVYVIDASAAIELARVEHGWADTFDAEYIALTQLHGTALVAGDDALRRAADGIVAVLTVDAFVRLP